MDRPKRSVYCIETSVWCSTVVLTEFPTIGVSETILSTPIAESHFLYLPIEGTPKHHESLLRAGDFIPRHFIAPPERGSKMPSPHSPTICEFHSARSHIEISPCSIVHYPFPLPTAPQHRRDSHHTGGLAGVVDFASSPTEGRDKIGRGRNYHTVVFLALILAYPIPRLAIDQRCKADVGHKQRMDVL